MLAAGLLQLALGAALLSPASLLAFISPATLRIEGLTGLPPLVLGNGVEQALAVVGVLQFYLGYLYCMAVYTSDRRFTHNSSTSAYSHQLPLFPPRSTPSSRQTS